MGFPMYRISVAQGIEQQLELSGGVELPAGIEPAVRAAPVIVREGGGRPGGKTHQDQNPDPLDRG